MAEVIIAAARREDVATLQEQLDYALALVSWSWIALSATYTSLWTYNSL